MKQLLRLTFISYILDYSDLASNSYFSKNYWELTIIFLNTPLLRTVWFIISVDLAVGAWEYSTHWIKGLKTTWNSETCWCSSCYVSQAPPLHVTSRFYSTVFSEWVWRHQQIAQRTRKVEWIDIMASLNTVWEGLLCWRCNHKTLVIWCLQHASSGKAAT